MKKTLKSLLRFALLLFVLLNVMLIFHAYKLTHFYDAQPAAIQAKKSGWATAGDIFFGINYYKQQNTLPDTLFETRYYKTSSGLQLQAWYMAVPSAKGTVALFHGHGGKKSSLLPEAAAFRHMRYNTLLLDFRAHGNSEGNTSTIGQTEAEDVKLAYDDIVAHGEKNIILYGISMGAAAIAKAMHDDSLHAQKIILEMPYASLPQAVEGRLKIMHLPPQPMAALLTFWGGTLHGFWAFNLEPAQYVKAIKCPALLQWGRHDPRVSQAETQELYNNIQSAKKLVVYENSAHESLYKKEPEKWLHEVTSFLQ